MIVIHCNFLTRVHGFRDNEVLLQVGYDVIVISPPGGGEITMTIQANSIRRFFMTDSEKASTTS